MGKKYTLTIEEGGQARTVDVTAAVAGLIAAVEGFYESWIEVMEDEETGAEDALESWTSSYGRAECEEEGFNAALKFVETVGVELPDPYALETEEVEA